MKIRDLRRQFTDLWQWVQTGPYHGNHLRGLNMREAWVVCEENLRPFMNLDLESPGRPSMRATDVYRFVRAGQIYYHAKKHGLNSALMLKLSLP